MADEPDIDEPISVHTNEELVPLTFGSLRDHVVSMLNDPAVMMYSASSGVLLMLGTIFYGLYKGTVGEEAEPGFAAAAAMLFYASLYFLVFGAGVVLLWYVCGFIFRDSARGYKKVKSFKAASFDETKSTLLLFAVSFAIAGSPFLMMGTYISAPFRMLLAPLLLIVAWFNQNAFIGVAFEPFRTFKTEGSDWKHFYLFVFGLAVVSCIGGLFFKVPYCSIIGVILIVISTLAFAAVTGWHCGRMIKKLEEPSDK